MVDYLLDTCFLFFFLGQHEKQLINFCDQNEVGITSFNLEEINYNLHKMGHEIKIRWRDFFKKAKFEIIDLAVKPGNKENEVKYISDYDPELLKIILDPSDAVLLVAGIKNKSNIITRDKHHLFTTKLENYLNGAGIKVFNNIDKE